MLCARFAALRRGDQVNNQAFLDMEDEVIARAFDGQLRAEEAAVADRRKILEKRKIRDMSQCMSKLNKNDGASKVHGSIQRALFRSF